MMKTISELKSVNRTERHYYFRKVEGKKIFCSTKPRKIKRAKSSWCYNYDETFLYHLYCCAGGKIERLLSMIEQMPPEAQKNMPKETTFYKLQKRNNWKERYFELQKYIQGELEKEIGMEYSRITKLGTIVLNGYFMVMAERLKKNQEAIKKAQDENKEVDENITGFSFKDFETVWKILRTERGLPQTITHTKIEKKHSDMLKDIIDSEGGEHINELVDGIPEEKLDEIMSILNVQLDEPPKFLTKG